MNEYIQRNPTGFAKLKPINMLDYTPLCNVTDVTLRGHCLVYLAKQLQGLINWFKVSAKIDQSEVAELADIIMEKFGDMSMPDFMLFIRYAKGGSMVVDGITRKFELPFNRLDAVVLIEWLTVYREAKNEAREHRHRMQVKKYLEPAAWTAEQQAAFDDFMKELRVSMLEKKEVDQEAAERERMARREQMISITMNDFAGTSTEELERCRPMVEGDMILMAAIDRILAARKGVAE